jgi:hypothetical protein
LVVCTGVGKKNASLRLQRYSFLEITEMIKMIEKKTLAWQKEVEVVMNTGYMMLNRLMFI